jgi:hypothetical protein
MWYVQCPVRKSESKVGVLQIGYNKYWMQNASMMLPSPLPIELIYTRASIIFQPRSNETTNAVSLVSAPTPITTKKRNHFFTLISHVNPQKKPSPILAQRTPSPITRPSHSTSKTPQRNRDCLCPEFGILIGRLGCLRLQRTPRQRPPV